MPNLHQSDNRWTERRVLVTGAGGFIGRRMTEKLLALGSVVTALDFAGADFPHGAKVELCDLRREHEVRSVLRNCSPELVIHLAATSDRSVSAEAVYTAYDSVLLPALNVLSACSALDDAPRVILFGSCDEYGRNSSPYSEEMDPCPQTPYAFAKAAVTRIALSAEHLFGNRITVARPSIVYGPGQVPAMFIPQAIATLLSGRPFEMTAGEQTRDFVYLDDMVEAALRLADTEASFGKVVNIASGNSVSIKDLALQLARVCGAEEFLRVGALPYRAGEVYSYAVDAGLLQRMLSWRPETTLEAGLHATIASFRQHHMENPS